MLREVTIDLDALQHNFREISALVSPARVMPIVKADAYGHGAVEVSRALISAGAEILGVADASEALALRSAGIRVPILCWILDVDDPLGPLITNQIQIGISTARQLELAAEAASLVGTARVHLKVDTGLGRNGLAASDWESTFRACASYVASGLLVIEGIFSHLANAGDAEDYAQRDKFETALNVASACGLEITSRHLAASQAALEKPELRYDLVRIGIAIYGQTPYPDRAVTGIGLRPAMRVSASVVNLKRVPAGHGVSYGLTYRTKNETTLALVSFGYADGLPRAAQGFEVLLNGKRLPIVGRIAMDQFVLDVGNLSCSIGDQVVILGDPAKDEPSVLELASKSATISYEIVTRMGHRPGRKYLGASSRG